MNYYINIDDILCVFIFLRFVDVELHGLYGRYGALNSSTILLENPVGKNVLTIDNFTKEVSEYQNLNLINCECIKFRFII